MALAPVLWAALGGAAYFAGYPGFGLWPLLFVFLLPLWWALDALGPAPRWGAAALVGLVFGLAAHAGGFAWLWRLADAFLAARPLVSATLLLLHALWFASGFAAYAALFAWLRRRGLGVASSGVPALVAVEWLQPQLFPVRAGAGLVDAPLLAQCADLGGPLLLTALLATWNAGLYALCLRRRESTGRDRWLPAVALALLLLDLAWGAARVHAFAGTPPGSEPLRVGIVQANVDPREKGSAAVAGHRLHVRESEALAAEGPLDLVIWPETAYAQGVQRPLPVDATTIRGPVLSRERIPLLFGTSSQWADDTGRVIANSVLLAGPDGRVVSAYDKNILIPLAEFVPFGAYLPELRTLLPHAQHYRAASETPALLLGDLRIATPICYEVIHAEFIARMVRAARPELIVTVANDAWFGRSREPRLHLALTRLRAIETRLPVIRATNSGISAIIDPTGRVISRTGILERARLRGVVHPRPSFTPYGRFGDAPVAAGLALWLAWIAWRLKGARRPARGSRPPAPVA